MYTIRLIFLSYLFLLTFLTSRAQDTQPIRLKKYDQNNGLSNNSVRFITKDQYGYLWAGTQEGLNVFDGKNFNTFSSQSPYKKAIQGSLIQELALSELSPSLWLLPSFAPINAIDIKSRIITTTIQNDDEGTPYDQIWARCMNLQGDVLWIAGDGTLSAYSTSQHYFLELGKIKASLSSKGEYNISKIIHDKLGQIWLFNENHGIEVIDSTRNIIQTISFDQLVDLKNHPISFRDAISINNNVYVASTLGLLHFNIYGLGNDSAEVKDVPKPLSEIEVRAIELISDHELLLCTPQDVFYYNLRSMEVKRLLDVSNGNQSLANVFHIYFDKSNQLVWLAAQSGLWSFKYPNSLFSPVTSSNNGTGLTNLYALLPTSETNILAGGSNGVFHVNLPKRQINLIDTAHMNLVIFRTSDKNTFLSNSKGFHLINKENKLYIHEDDSVLIKLQSDLYNKAIQFNDSLILLSSILQKGLTVWDTKEDYIITFHNDSIDYEIPELSVINYLFRSKSERVFILTDKSIISFNPLNKSHETYIINNPKVEERVANFMDMNESPDSYFIGTYGDGLIETDKQFNVKKVYTTQDGLSNNCIYRIFNIRDKKMLMTSNEGLSILDLNTKKFKTYFEGDGLHGNGFEQLCGYQKDNKIYVGGPGGFTIVNTDLLPDSSVAPILYPTGITINTPDGKIDSTHLEMTSFTIPNNAFKTTLNFVSPDYKNPDRMKYRYKIDELSKKWVDLGNQNFVDLIGVNPGKYHFEVIATNSEGTDSEPLKMTLDFLPKWYQTTWFKILLLLLVAGLVYMVQRYRMIQLQKQQLIRKEIANDLHDDIGSTLNSLKIFAHLAQSDSNNKGHIKQIEESVSEATVGLRDMIWVLEDEQDSVYEIMERVKKFASPICMAHNIELICEVKATSDKAIPKKIKRNLFLVAKECINNSVKYAECTEIQILIEYNKTKLKLKVSDNGKGFDPDQIAKGKGLNSMQYRASQVQFDCQVISDPDQGTVTEFAGMIS